MNSDCRLCLTKCEEFVEIFSEYGNEQNIPALITKYFWFEVSFIIYISSKICFIYNLHKTNLINNLLYKINKLTNLYI